MSMESEGGEGETSVRNNGALLAGVVRIACSFVSRNHVPASELPGLITSVHTAVLQIVHTAPPQAQKPAISIKKSYGDDFIICLEDGKRLTMLKRYLRTHFGMSVEDYRAKWGLPRDYPMVAPAYARLRSAFAKRFGLGKTATPHRKRRPKK